MSIQSRLAHAATSINSSLFKRVSTNPTTNSSSNYLDMMYGGDYYKVRRYREYHQMMKDPQVKIGLSILNMFLLSRDIHVTPGGEEDIDKEAADFLENELKNDMETPFRNVRKNIYTAIPYGFSAQEVVYKLRDDSKIGIKGIYAIHRKTLDHIDAFVFDDNENLVELNQRNNIMGFTNTIPIEKVLLYSHDMEFDNPRGNAILEEIYDTVYEKKQTYRTLAVFIHKHGAPFLLAKLSEESMAFKGKVVQQLEDVAEGRTNMTVGKDDEVDIKESQYQGVSIFENIKLHDAVIFRRMFIGTLMMGQLDASGSYAQSDSQLSVTRMLLDGVHEEIAGAMQKKFDEFNNWNFSGAKCPNISFEKFEDKDILGLLNALQPYFKDMIIAENQEWLNKIIEMAVKEATGIDVELNPDTSTTDEGINLDGSVDPLPGSNTSPLKDTLNSMLPPK